MESESRPRRYITIILLQAEYRFDFELPMSQQEEKNLLGYFSQCS